MVIPYYFVTTNYYIPYTIFWHVTPMYFKQKHGITMLHVQKTILTLLVASLEMAGNVKAKRVKIK